MSEAKILDVWVDRNTSAYTFDEPKDDNNFPGSRASWSRGEPLKVAEIVSRHQTAELVDRQYVVHGVTRTVKCLKLDFRPPSYTGSKPYSIILTPFMAMEAAKSNIYGLFLSPHQPSIDMYNSFDQEKLT